MNNLYNNTMALPMHFIAKVFVFASIFFSVSISIVQADTFTPANVIDLVNQSRFEAGLNTLTENSKLTQAAQDKANDMIANDYFAHTSPQGITPWFWLKKEGYVPKSAGENLAINFTTAKSQHDGWMASTTHRENILSPKYQEIGVAVVEGSINGEKTIVTVQLFGTSTVSPSVAGHIVTTTEDLVPVTMASHTPVKSNKESLSISQALMAMMLFLAIGFGMSIATVYDSLLLGAARYIVVARVLTDTPIQRIV